MKKCLITGINGFIGSNLAKRLIEEGFEVHGLIRKTSDLKFLKNLDIKYHYGDITNFESIKEATTGCYRVFHVAALASDWGEYDTFYKINVEGTLIEIGESRSINKHGKELKVANAILKDDSDSIKLTLWNDDVSRFKAGDKIKITNGYASEFQGEKQLTSGKFGKIEKLNISGEIKLNPEEFSSKDLEEGAENYDEDARISDDQIKEEDYM